MRLKLTLETARDAVDVIVDADPSARVGALADRMAAAGARPEVEEGHTLELQGHGSGEIEAASLISQSGLRSGCRVRLVAPGGRFGAPKAASAAAILRVLSGPDQGREFPLTAGASVIGRDPVCEAQLTDPLVSRQHARILIGDTVELIDLGSANGLLLGDEVSDRVTVGPNDRVQLGDTVISVNLMVAGYRSTHSGFVAFNRSPVVEPRDETEPLRPPAPPDTPRNQRFPIIPLFFPAVMGMVMYLATHSLTSLIFVAMSPLMMIGNVAEGRVASRRGYAAALSLFREDVAGVVSEAQELQRREVADRNIKYPSGADCATAAQHLTPLIWSRWPDLPRFLELRLGLGTQPSRVEIEFPQGSQSNRAVWQELRQALAPLATVGPVPVVVHLGEEGALGVGGPRAASLDVARALLTQVTALHSPVDLSLAVVSSTRSSADWEWVKWLPHCLSPGSPLEVFPLASTQGQCSTLFADLERIINEREAKGKEGKGSQPAILLVIDDSETFERNRAVALAQRGANVAVHVLWVAADRAALPAICRTFVETFAISGESVAARVHSGETVQPLSPDIVDAQTASVYARSLAALTDSSAMDDDQSDLPKSVSFLSLVGTDVANRPDSIIDRWTESRSIVTGPYATGSPSRRPGTLRALLGVTAGGPHVLDLRANGPHALVGGTTGSGKSELLQSWILGMALANSPQRVTFLLVDYKGGSAFSECVKLPHTVGLVTDLSPHLVRRALTSLKAELRHREHILHRKRAKDLLEIERVADPDCPPSLIIVVDEFAALVNEVPEFVDGVVDVAQRGRSLGLHLILATQRPAGVIKDNLRANTNLRLALRMADEADSSDVLGSPQAAAFDPAIPGRAVSRTGPSKLVPFQSAYVGGWTSDVEPPARIEVQTFGFAPTRVWEAPVLDGSSASDELGPTDIQRIVANLNDASQRAEIPPPRQPWKPELSPVYDLARLPTQRRDESLVFGVMDDPNNQQQPTVAFHPDEDGNLAIFGTGNSGKTTFLRTLAVASGFTVRGGPCHVYALDFGSRGLQPLEELPHVGSVISGNDHERLTRLLTMLRGTIDQRAVRYGKVGAGTITSYRQLAHAPDEPRILLLIDGMSAFRSAYEGTEHSRWFEQFLSIAGDGRPVGVHVVVAADRPGAMPSKLNALVQRRIVLRLADSNDYVFLGVPADVLDGKSPAGRGLMLESELQIAILGGRPDNLDQTRAINAFAESMRTAGASAAPPVESLTDQVALDDLPVEVGGLPVLGLSGITLSPIGLDPRGTFSIAGPSGSGRTTAMRTVFESVRRWKPTIRTYFFGGRRSSLGGLPWDKAALNPEDALELANEVATQVGAGTEEAAIAVFIEGLTDFAGSPAEMAMQQMVKALVADDQLVVSEGEATALNGAQPLIVGCRASKIGIVLQPDQSDGMMFKAQFPRVRKADFPPGRGLLVARGGEPVAVQVAM